jgi:phosphoribosylaminoimidazole (AIR) synthetase
MYRVFNMGVGLIGIVPAERVGEALGTVPEAVVVGEVIPRGDDGAVRLLGLAV